MVGRGKDTTFGTVLNESQSILFTVEKGCFMCVGHAQYDDFEAVAATTNTSIFKL